MTAAHSGKHFPKRVEDAIHGYSHGFKILIADVSTKQPLLGFRVFAVGFNVDAEVFVVFGISEAIMFFQSVNFGFSDRRDLTFVCVKRRQTFNG